MAIDQNDALLGQILKGQGELLAVLTDIRDRLPVPTPMTVEPLDIRVSAPPTGGGPDPSEPTTPTVAVTADRARESGKTVPDQDVAAPAKKTTAAKRARGKRAGS